MSKTIDFDAILDTLNCSNEDARYHMLLACKGLAAQLITWLITAESLDPAIVARVAAATSLDELAEIITSRKKT